MNSPLQLIFTLLATTPLGLSIARAQDLLPSWNDGAAKQAIVDFVPSSAPLNSLRRPEDGPYKLAFLEFGIKAWCCRLLLNGQNS